MVDKLKGFFLVLLVVLLSAVFALQFGGGQAEGCAAGGSTYLARVYDQTLSKGDFEAAYCGGQLRETTRRDATLDAIARAGARRPGRPHPAGARGTQSRFRNQPRRSHGAVCRTTAPFSFRWESERRRCFPQGEIPVSFTDKEGAFNKDLAERYIQNGLRRSVGEFADAQVDEHLAAHDARAHRVVGQCQRG